MSLNGNNYNSKTLTDGIAISLIKAYKEKHPEINQDLLPHVYLAWGNGKECNEVEISRYHHVRMYTAGATYLDTRTGVRSKTPPIDSLCPISIPEEFIKAAKSNKRITSDNHIDYGSDEANNFFKSLSGKLTTSEYYNHWASGDNKDMYKVLYRKAGGVLATPYIHYDEELGVTALGLAVMDGCRTQEEGTRRMWVIPGGVKFLIGKVKKLYDCDYNTGPRFRFWYRGHRIYNVTDGSDTQLLNEMARATPNVIAIDEAKKAIGDHIVLAGGNIRDLVSMYTVFDWYNYKEPTHRSDKSKTDVDRLISIELRDINDISNQYPLIVAGRDISQDSYVTGLYYFERIDGYDVIRYIDRIGADKRPVETFRAYIPDKGTKVVCIRDTTENGWVKCNNISTSYWKSSYIANAAELDNMKRLKYIKDIIRGLSRDMSSEALARSYPVDEIRLSNVIQVLRNPIIEKISKAGYHKLALSLIGNINDNIQKMFGYYDKKASTIYGALGVNKEQLDWWYNTIYSHPDETAYIEHRYYSNWPSSVKYNELAIYNRLFSYIRKLYKMSSKDTISSHDFDTFKEMVYFIGRWVQDRYTYEVENFVFPGVDSFTEQKKVIHKIVKIMNKKDSQRDTWIFNPERGGNDGVLRIKQTIRDVTRLFFKLPLHYRDRIPEISWSNFDQESSWNRLHDMLVELDNEYHREILQVERELRAANDKKLLKIYEETKKERIKLEYEDDDYIIKLPDVPEDIRTEGLKLNHCVGGYVNDHISGKTTIMFLRQKSNPDKSWYTIEIRNGSIKQIHGYGNQWVAYNDSGVKAVPTLMRWIHKNKLLCPSEILTSKAAGYSNYGCQHISLPEITYND